MALPPKKATLTLSDVKPAEEPKAKKEKPPRVIEYPTSRSTVFRLEGFVTVLLPEKPQVVESQHLKRKKKKSIYAQFVLPTCDGSVQVCAYGRAIARYAGQSIVAKLVVKRAEYEKRKTKIHVDLELAPAGTEPTHDFVVYVDAKEQKAPANATFWQEVRGGVIAVLPKPTD